jgi:hypothetical protein
MRYVRSNRNSLEVRTEIRVCSSFDVSACAKFGIASSNPATLLLIISFNLGICHGLALLYTEVKHLQLVESREVMHRTESAAETLRVKIKNIKAGV